MIHTQNKNSQHKKYTKEDTPNWKLLRKVVLIKTISKPYNDILKNCFAIYT